MLKSVDIPDEKDEGNLPIMVIFEMHTSIIATELSDGYTSVWI
jgi:hypothetical protein